jgi:tetratricopeptide (TPR) repeat protein
MKNLIFLSLFLISCVKKTESISTSYDKPSNKHKEIEVSKEFANQEVGKDKKWKQKGESYLKKGKFRQGMDCLNEAVKLNEKSWKPYHAFAKCIYLKNYDEAIIELEDYKNRFGNVNIEGHDCDFYLGLCYLQKNDFELAKKYFVSKKNNNSTELFYIGIIEFKLRNYKQAISYFDEAIKVYPNFSDAKYYKSICLSKFDKFNEASILLQEAKQDAKNKFSINESNGKYTKYPYQVEW